METMFITKLDVLRVKASAPKGSVVSTNLSYTNPEICSGVKTNLQSPFLGQMPPERSKSKGSVGETAIASLPIGVLCPGDAVVVRVSNPSNYPTLSPLRLSPSAFVAHAPMVYETNTTYVFTYSLPVPARLSGTGWGDVCTLGNITAVAENCAGCSAMEMAHHSQDACDSSSGFWCSAQGDGFCYTPGFYGGSGLAQIETIGASAAFGVENRTDLSISSWNASLSTVVYGSAGIFVGATSPAFTCPSSLLSVQAGSPASLFVGALQVDGNPGAVCSGTLMGQNSFITAAHCVVDSLGFSSSARIHLGSSDLALGASYDVLGAVYPSGYSTGTPVNDSAIILLDYDGSDQSPFQVSPVIGLTFDVFGWGVTSLASRFTASELHDIPVVVSKCDDLLCFSSSVASTCPGDSGGPLVSGTAVGASVSAGACQPGSVSKGTPVAVSILRAADCFNNARCDGLTLWTPTNFATPTSRASKMGATTILGFCVGAFLLVMGILITVLATRRPKSKPPRKLPMYA